MARDNKYKIKQQKLDQVRRAHHAYLDAEDSQNLSVVNRCAKVLEIALAEYRSSNVEFHRSKKLC